MPKHTDREAVRQQVNQQEDPESFIPNYMSWGDPRVATAKGGRKGLDKRLAQRGMGVTAGIKQSETAAKAAAGKESNLPSTRAKNELSLRNLQRLRETPGVGDYPTGIHDIAERFGGFFGQATQRGIASAATLRENRPVWDQGEVPGTAWYFGHRRTQAEKVDPSLSLSSRQASAMGAKLSSGKTPEDEQASMGGISRLAGSLSNRKLEGRRVSSFPSEELASHASSAAAWGAYEDEMAKGGTKKTTRPEGQKPQATPEVFSALREAGRAHEPNIAVATQIGRGEITPREGFGESTPKTGAYGEMQAQSNPGSVVETDYRNIAAHHRDVTAGTQSRDQGMFVFSQEEPGKRAYALRSNAPTAIDTWMHAAGSGQPMGARNEMGHMFSPAKRIVDKNFPLDPSATGKQALGLPVRNQPGADPSVNSITVLSAQHNEAIRHLSENVIGSISRDQHGQDIHIPSSLIQETVWTEARRQAGEDPAYAAHQRTLSGIEKTKTKRAAAFAKLNKNQTLF